MKLRMKVGEKTTAEDVKVYAQAVNFIAYWIKKHHDDLGQPTDEILKEFDANVCTVMVGEVKGNG